VNLRQLAAQDLGNIIEDSVAGFGWPVTVTDPAGTTLAATGFSNDISLVIDPDTGLMVSGRSASVTFRIASMTLGPPVGVSDAKAKPWVVEFDDIDGASYKFKVQESNPDRALGVIVCILEAYE
jgi:hypothetical protein